MTNDKMRMREILADELLNQHGDDVNMRACISYVQGPDEFAASRHDRCKLDAALAAMSRVALSGDGVVRDVLHNIQWNGGYDCLERPLCPSCQSFEAIGHIEDCALKAALSKPAVQETGDYVLMPKRATLLMVATLRVRLFLSAKANNELSDDVIAKALSWVLDEFSVPTPRCQITDAMVEVGERAYNANLNKHATDHTSSIRAALTAALAEGKNAS